MMKKPSLGRCLPLWGVALLAASWGCSDAAPRGSVGGVAREGTPIGHWSSSGSRPLEVVFHDTGELTWMEDSEEAGSWEAKGEGRVLITRPKGASEAAFRVSGDSLTLTFDGQPPLTLKKQ